MIELDIITNNGEIYKFGEVDQKTIHKNIKSVTARKDGKFLQSFPLQKGERALIRKRTNTAEGSIFIIGSHKKGKQKLTFITEDGKILEHGKDCNCDHIFHSEVEIGEHEQ